MRVIASREEWAFTAQDMGGKKRARGQYAQGGIQRRGSKYSSVTTKIRANQTWHGWAAGRQDGRVPRDASYAWMPNEHARAGPLA